MPPQGVLGSSGRLETPRARGPASKAADSTTFDRLGTDANPQSEDQTTLPYLMQLVAAYTPPPSNPNLDYWP